jgi:drug/metabolite transporter (DMT)-like permease
MSPARLVFLTTVAMLAFAGNSLFCRLALRQTSIDVAMFTMVRLVSGALALLLLVAAAPAWRAWRARAASAEPGEGPYTSAIGGDWGSALVLALYAWTFSAAYVSISAGAGALLLFGAVQLTMLVSGWRAGERPALRQAAGFMLSFGGLLAMMLPGLSAPPLLGALTMLASGVFWGLYSLRGRGGKHPAATTTGNFVRAVPLSIAPALVFALSGQLRPDATGILYAILSGVFASGMGYIFWYAALRQLSATRAASVQLSVPILAAVGGMLLLGEPLSLRLVLSGVAILGGIAIVVLGEPARAAPAPTAASGLPSPPPRERQK